MLLGLAVASCAMAKTLECSVLAHETIPSHQPGANTLKSVNGVYECVVLYLGHLMWYCESGILI